MFDYILHVILPLAPRRSTSLLPTASNFVYYFFNNPPSPFYAAHIFVGVGPSTGVWSTYHGLKEIWFPFLPKPPVINSSSVMSGNSGSQELTRSSPLLDELLSDSILDRPCKGNHSCSKVMSAVSLSHREDTISLWSSTISGFLQYFHLLFQDIFSALGVVSITQMSHVWQRSCCHCSLTSSEHLLPKETFVMSSESCCTPWL